MASRYLAGLSSGERRTLETTLWNQQNGHCFICEQQIDLSLHGGNLDIDHVEPLSTGGHDDPTNFALTHASCNRSKLAANLQVARALARFSRIQEASFKELGHGPNLSQIFATFSGAKYPAHLTIDGDVARVAFPETGDNSIREFPILTDPLSAFRSFFAAIPIEYLYHDDKINPRPIGSTLRGLVEEFFRRRPQLHVALAWTSTKDPDGPRRFAVFDGQHKAAA